MKPVIDVSTESSIVSITLGLDMTQDEILDFLVEFKRIVQRFNDSDTVFSVLNDASEKSFTDLNAVRELSIGMRRVLALGNIGRVAVCRPQGDYAVDETEDHSDRMQVFNKLDAAKNWLYQKSHSKNFKQTDGAGALPE